MKKLLQALMITSGVSLISGLAMPDNAYAAPPAKAFGELPIAFDADLSPDGKRLAAILNIEGQYYYVSWETGSAVPELKGSGLGEDVRPLYVKWVNNDRYFVSFEKTEEQDGVPFSVGYIYTNDISEKKVRILIQPKFFRQENNTIVNWLDDDPNHVLMSYTQQGTGGLSNRNLKKGSKEEWPGVFKVNVKNGRGKIVQERREFITRWITDPSGNPIIGIGSNDGVDKMVVKNAKTEKWSTHKSYPGLDADTPIFAVLKGGTKAVVGDYNGRDTLGLYVYDFDQKKLTTSLFHNDGYDVSGVVMSRDGETIMGAKYVAEREETELFGEYGTLIEQMRAKYVGYSIDYVDQTEDGNKVLFMLSAPYEPGGLFIYKAGDTVPKMLERRYSGLSASEMGDVITANYTARDGQIIPAFITLPPTIKSTSDLKNLPFIVLPHGGPYGRDEKRFDYFAQFFATRGYGVMQMNFRGSEGYGKTFEDAGRDNWSIMQEDVEDATRSLLQKGYADPSRTCIAGWSYGGYAALMGAAKDTEGLYDCVISMAGLTDIDDAKKDMKDYVGGRAVAREFFGDSMQSSDIRKANSPVDVADQITVPVFLAHGELDENVRYTQFKRMKRALEKAGANATFLSFEEEDHFLSKQKNREAFFIGIDKFLTEVNGPSEHMTK